MPEHPAAQPDLFDAPSPPPPRAFDGATYDAARDYERLDGQLGRVFRLMRDGEWRTLERIKFIVGGTEASISARLRDFRKAKYGCRVVERRYLHNGLYEYRLINATLDAGQSDDFGRTSRGGSQDPQGNQTGARP